MLTNLNQLEIGAKWPPSEEIAKRVTQLNEWKELFHGEHDSIYKNEFRRTAEVIGAYDDIRQYEIILNYHKHISVKTADLLLGETPIIECPDKEAMALLISSTDYWGVMLEAVLDISRYGCSIVNVSKDPIDSQVYIDIIPAQYWIPVVSVLNQKRIVNHIIVWTECIKNKTRLTIQIHHKGFYEVRVHELDGNSIGPLLSSEVIKTGLNDFAIVVLSNLTSSDSIYGISDYADLDSIIQELEIRLSQNSRILDKHADPMLIMPVIEQDPLTGENVMCSGSVIEVTKEMVEPKYISYEADLQAGFTQVETLTNKLAVISEMGIFVKDSDEKLGNLSGTALRKLAFAPLSKVARLSVKISTNMIKILKLASQLTGKDLTNDVITITFRDGLPEDMKETTAYASQGKTAGIISTYTAIKMLHEGISDEQIAVEMERIAKETGGTSNEHSSTI